jgi:hypothetical protein
MTIRAILVGQTFTSSEINTLDLTWLNHAYDSHDRDHVFCLFYHDSV